MAPTSKVVLLLVALGCAWGSAGSAARQSGALRSFAEATEAQGMKDCPPCACGACCYYCTHPACCNLYMRMLELGSEGGRQ